MSLFGKIMSGICGSTADAAPASGGAAAGAEDRAHDFSENTHRLLPMNPEMAWRGSKRCFVFSTCLGNLSLQPVLATGSTEAGSPTSLVPSDTLANADSGTSLSLAESE